MRTLAATILTLALTASPAAADVQVLPDIIVPDTEAPAVASYLRAQAIATGLVVELDGELVPPALDLLTWARIARCESSGRWFIPSHTRGGSSGYLQIIRTTWLAHGGGQYAPEAWQAGPAEQLDIARNIMTASGLRPWTCRGAA